MVVSFKWRVTFLPVFLMGIKLNHLKSNIITQLINLSPLSDGCPGLCNGNGQCIMGQNSWHCECHTGWRGPGCSVAMETSCNDNKDNEGGKKCMMNAEIVSFLFDLVCIISVKT